MISGVIHKSLTLWAKFRAIQYLVTFKGQPEGLQKKSISSFTFFFCVNVNNTHVKKRKICTEGNEIRKKKIIKKLYGLIGLHYHNK